MLPLQVQGLFGYNLVFLPRSIEKNDVLWYNKLNILFSGVFV